MSIIKKISSQLSIRVQQVRATINLLDDGNTIPFIARYRKEVTSSLDEEQIRQIFDSLNFLRALEIRRVSVLKNLQEQGNLTKNLKTAILNAETRTALEDLYLPFKPKRKTRAGTARKNGLQSLADLILNTNGIDQKQSLEILAAPYLTDQITTIDDAWAGARDIVAETISNHIQVRQILRKNVTNRSNQQVKKIKKASDPRGLYNTYHQFSCRVNRLRAHQILAINRGEKEKILRVKIIIQEHDWRNAIKLIFKPNKHTHLNKQLAIAIDDAAERLLLPAIVRHIRRNLTEIAEKHAIQVFSSNLRALLIQPPLSGHTILGIDPGYRSGCKVAVVDSTGKPLATKTIYPFNHGSKEKSSNHFYTQSQDTIAALVEQYGVTLIAIGNGTASRETEQLIAEYIKHSSHDIHYLIVNEAGASVYSASKLARLELPLLDVTLRGAVSIARRVQDPLSELVKIAPHSIGVGMYQHDVNQKALNRSLDAVVESVVNHVGIDLNTASTTLLSRISGIGPKLATNIVAYRNQNGAYRNREVIKNVPGIGIKAFQQAAGFLRVKDGDNPLDATAIHPESYSLAKAVLEYSHLDEVNYREERETSLSNLQSPSTLAALAQSLGAGIPTLEDIIEQLIRPGRDPRTDLATPILRSDICNMEDLVNGMVLKGTVRNVVDFGAFIDIGVKQDGLLHRSRIPRNAQLKVGDVINIEILDIDIERGRISLGLNSST